MPYPEIMIHGMRAELAQLGIEETKTTEEVKAAVELLFKVGVESVNVLVAKGKRKRFGQKPPRWGGKPGGGKSGGGGR